MERARAPHWILVVDFVTRPIWRLQKSPLLGLESQCQRIDGRVHMRDLCGTHDRNVVVGTPCHPSHGDMCRSHAMTRSYLAHTAYDLAIDIVAVVFLI